jgi:transcriptional regulator with XRE-family HTH domain
LEISPDDSEFAQALKKYVKENKVTLSWIAKRIGVSPRSVSKWMSSQNIPTERSAAKLRAIGIDPSAWSFQLFTFVIKSSIICGEFEKGSRKDMKIGGKDE